MAIGPLKEIGFREQSVLDELGCSKLGSRAFERPGAGLEDLDEFWLARRSGSDGEDHCHQLVLLEERFPAVQQQERDRRVGAGSLVAVD